MKKIVTVFVFLLSVFAQAQVKIGNNPGTIDANSLLELESTNKGFLPPRIALNSISSVSPLTGTVPAGMLVFSTGGTLTDGYYYWNGTEWELLATKNLNVVTKTANATLTKIETFILASNDISLTLPVVTSADNGMEITVKNVGTHTNLITIQGNGGATIDNVSTSTLTRYCSQTFVATAGNWVIKEKGKRSENLLEVNNKSSWTTLKEAIEFLNLHMTGPSVIRLGEETYSQTETIVVNLPYPLTFQGLSYSSSSIVAASGLAGKPMFRCISDCYFKMLQFDATTLTNYGTAAGEDAIRFLGSGTYNEVKDCSFDRFYNTILDSTNAELWVFETDIANAQNNGILIHGAVAGVIVKVAETDFIGCARGINLDKATSATIQLSSGGYYNTNSTDTAIIYKPATFTSYTSISIKGNLWNNTGKYIEGFDFTRSDGRDANAIVESNAGMGDKNPNCNINVLNNATTTSTTSTSTWYKANWTNTSSTTTKWTISNNKITYQPNNRRNGWVIISGNLSSSSASSTINIGIVKNGASGTRYGETTLKTTTANIPFQFSTVVYLADIAPGDYFEIWVNSTVSSSTVTVQDILWFVNTQ